jgi:peptide deformylase
MPHYNKAMARLQILRYPDPRLHRKAKPIAQIDDRIRQLAADMAETMYEAPGIGLAATQVDVHEQLIVVDVSDSRDQLMVLINPVLLSQSEQLNDYEEGCLSVPGIYDDVSRPAAIEVKAFDLAGEPFVLRAEGLLAVCIQHEMDHLQGKVFVQHLSRLKQSRIRAKMLKQEKERDQDHSGEATPVAL